LLALSTASWPLEKPQACSPNTAWHVVDSQHQLGRTTSPKVLKAPDGSCMSCRAPRAAPKTAPKPPSPQAARALHTMPVTLVSLVGRVLPMPSLYAHDHRPLVG